MKSSHFFLLFFLFTLPAFGQQTKFSRKEVLSDLHYLRNSLEEAHYNVYAYTSQEAFDAAYQKVKASITKDSFNLLETTSLFQRLITVVKNGHTEIDFPGQSYGEYAYAGGTIFPLEIAFEEGKPLVRKNWSDNDNIAVGSEVLSINDEPIEEVLSKIYPQISAERRYFKNTKLEVFSFPRYYWQVYGKTDAFEVVIRIDDTTKTYKLEAIDLIEGYEMKRTEVLNAKMTLSFFTQAAYLNPGNLSGDEPMYQRFIDSAFAAINEAGSQYLIIDLRNNQGGDDNFSDYLVSYIADKPFRWCSHFSLKSSALLKEQTRKNNDTTKAFFQGILAHADGAVYEYEFDPYPPQPEDRRFTGKVYVLINRQSHSQSAVAAAQIQDYQFGTIVGEETGDSPTLYAAQFIFPLPKTGIPVRVSKGYMVRVNGSTKEEGVIPDIFINDYLLDEEDEILDGLLEKIDKAK